MTDRENLYKTFADIVNAKCSGHIYIWGTGEDATILYNAVKNILYIKSFVDTYKSETTFQGREIISKEQFLRCFLPEDMLIIATYKFAKEILRDIEGGIVIPGKNCFILDEQHVFKTDNNVDRFIGFNRKNWKKKKQNNTEKQILIPFMNIHDGAPIIYSYFANRMAEKYHAKIIAYPCRGISAKNASGVMRCIYESFNTEKLIDIKLNKQQVKLAHELVEEKWKLIKEWKDWKELEFFGIKFGTTIVRDMNRFYLPGMNPKDLQNRDILQKCVQTIVFWNDYFERNQVETVFLKDGASWEGYIREIALSRGIPIYALQCIEYFRRLFHDFCVEPHVTNYMIFWQQLSLIEQEYGLKWGKNRLKARLKGSEEDIPYMLGKSVFKVQKSESHYLKESDKIKLLICPHTFEEDSYVHGEHVFDNNYFSWLTHLGELSNKYNQYEWYVKQHPNASQRDRIIIRRFINSYPNILEIPSDVSPHQLKEEGLSCVLTVYGTVGHEYPALGIPVICAGVNGHSAFHFTHNPMTKEEHDEYIRNVGDLSTDIDMKEIYIFYAMHYLFYKREPMFLDDFFKDPLLYAGRDELMSKGMDYGTWKYERFMDMWEPEWHEHLYHKIDEMMEKMDNWRPDIFYKNQMYRKE